MASIVAPLAQFFAVSGVPLEAGYVYIGEAGGNPETAPLAVYWDEALTQPASQPLRTSRGFIARGGTASAVYVSGDYSLTVRQRTRELVTYMPRLSGASTRGAVSATADPGAGGMWPDETASAQIVRARDRLFVGGGAAFTGNRTGTQGGFAPTSTEGANWAARDSRLFVASDEGLIQVCGFVSNANIDDDPPTESIGVAGLAIGNKTGRSVWGLYSDVQFEVGNYGYGIEFAIKNKGADTTSTPYLPTTGTYGVWLAAGGDASYGGAAAAPSNTAIAIGRTNGAPFAWNKGLIFFHDGLTRSGSGYSTAIELAEKHRVVWRTALNTVGFDVRSEVSAASSEVAIIATNNVVSVAGAGGALITQFAHQASAVNYMQVLNSATGNSVQLVAAGTDTDINVRAAPKGDGCFVVAGVRSFANDAAAAAATPAVPIGGVYRNGSALQIRVS